MPPWHRPNSLNFPEIWHSFKAIDPDTSQLTRYHVQDLPEECFEEAIDLLSRSFLSEEPLCRALKISDDPASRSEAGRIWRELASQRIVQVCYREGTDEIVALDLLNVVGKEDRQRVQSERLNRIFKVHELLLEKGNVFEKNGVDQMLCSGGLFVTLKYRGFKIAPEVLKTRRVICEALGLKLSAAMFTSSGSQIAARKVGFKDEVVMCYDELVQERLEFHEVKNTFVKLMSSIVK